MCWSMSERTVSTANSGMPWAWASIGVGASAGSRATRPSSSARIAGRQRVEGDQGAMPADAEAGPLLEARAG